MKMVWQKGSRQACRCGSKMGQRPRFDARGIFLFYCCDKCEKGKLEGIRPEVLTDPNYDAPDLGDDEELV